MRIVLGMIAIGAVVVLALVWTSADARYQCAERLFQKGEFEKASMMCERALLCNPRHAPTRALYTELQFILGKGKATPNTGEYDRFMLNPCYTPTSQLLNEIDFALAKGERHHGAGEREAGLVEVRKALEFVKWMPEGQDLSARRNRAEFLRILLASDGSTDD